MDIKKIDDNSIEITKVENRVSTNVFTYEYLTSQREAIQAQKNKDNIQRDLELAEIDVLLAECDKIGVMANPIKEVII